MNHIEDAPVLIRTVHFATSWHERDADRDAVARVKLSNYSWRRVVRERVHTIVDSPFAATPKSVY